jgi:hypothetical protein
MRNNLLPYHGIEWQIIRREIMTTTPDNKGTAPATPEVKPLDVEKLTTTAKTNFEATPPKTGYGAQHQYGTINQPNHSFSPLKDNKTPPTTPNTGTTAVGTAAGKVEKGLFNNVGESIKKNWAGDLGKNFENKVAGAEKPFMGGGKGVMIVGGTVGIGAAIDGVRRMVTRPVGEDGQPGDRSFGRIAIGAIEGIGGSALALTSLAGSLRR